MEKEEMTYESFLDILRGLKAARWIAVCKDGRIRLKPPGDNATLLCPIAAVVFATTGYLIEDDQASNAGSNVLRLEGVVDLIIMDSADSDVPNSTTGRSDMMEIFGLQQRRCA